MNTSRRHSDRANNFCLLYHVKNLLFAILSVFPEHRNRKQKCLLRRMKWERRHFWIMEITIQFEIQELTCIFIDTASFNIINTLGSIAERTSVFNDKDLCYNTDKHMHPLTTPHWRCRGWFRCIWRHRMVTLQWSVCCWASRPTNCMRRTSVAGPGCCWRRPTDISQWCLSCWVRAPRSTGMTG